jgi:hypothetical protein
MKGGRESRSQNLEFGSQETAASARRLFPALDSRSTLFILARVRNL